MECISEGCNKVVKNPNKNSRCQGCKNNLNRYNLTLPQRDELHRSQNGKCAICKDRVEFYDSNFPLPYPRACVDHCHTTGDVRGILCHSCNGGLGLFKDNISSLEEAITYLGGT